MAERTKKFLCHYEYCETAGDLAGIIQTDWHKINATVASNKRVSYPQAETLLKRSVHRSEKTKGRAEIKLLHLYDILV